VGLKHVGANTVTSVTAYVILYSYIQVHKFVQIKSMYLSLFFCLFMLCSASVIALQSVFRNSSYKSASKWERYQIFKEDKLLVRV